MVPPTDGISNWMNMFRWIVKLIRDEHGVDEACLVRSAVLEADCGLQIEDVEGLSCEAWAVPGDVGIAYCDYREAARWSRRTIQLRPPR